MVSFLFFQIFHMWNFNLYSIFFLQIFSCDFFFFHQFEIVRAVHMKRFGGISIRNIMRRYLLRSVFFFFVIIVRNLPQYKRWRGNAVISAQIFQYLCLKKKKKIDKYFFYNDETFLLKFFHIKFLTLKLETNEKLINSCPEIKYDQGR